MSMTEEWWADWMTAVVDAQTEWETLTPEEQALETGEDPADEYWGFFTLWRESLAGAYWDEFCEEAT